MRKLGFWRNCGMTHKPQKTASQAHSPSKNFFLLVDINSYFATLLQQENPALREKPVVVVKDLGRTCVIAASKEAKKLGIKTGTNTNDAKRLAPNLIEVKAEFEMYLSATRRLKNIFTQVAPRVYIFSLDEAFINLGDCLKYFYKDPVQVARNIQEKIKADLGSWVTCNIGLGPNRLLAKMACEISPKGSIFEINEDNVDEILASVEFSDVCGIGRRLGKRLHLIDVHHPYQLRFFDYQDLEPIFGKFWAKELLKIAWGEEPHFLNLLARKEQPMKTVGRSITLWKTMTNDEEIKRIFYNLSCEVMTKARRMNLVGRQVFIGVEGSLYGFYDHITLPHYVCHSQEFYDQVIKLYEQFTRNFGVIRLRVGLGLLGNFQMIPLPILEDWYKKEKLELASEAVNNRYGLFTVKVASLLDKPIIKPEVTGFLGDRQYQLA